MVAEPLQEFTRFTRWIQKLASAVQIVLNGNSIISFLLLLILLLSMSAVFIMIIVWLLTLILTYGSGTQAAVRSMYVDSDYDGLMPRRNIEHRHSVNGRQDDDLIGNRHNNDDNGDDDGDDDDDDDMNVQLNGSDARRRPDSPVLRPLPSVLFIFIIIAVLNAVVII